MSMLQASPDGIREKRKHRSKAISYEDGVTNWNGQVSIVRWLIVSMTCLFFIRGIVSANNSAEVAKAISAHSHVTQLFNGNDLSGFYTWLKESGRKDPNNVFSVTYIPHIEDL